MQVEDFYLSSAAGRARIVLGNRRWGENGYVASGRQQGRPVQRTPNNKVCNDHTARCLVCCMPLHRSSIPSLSWAIGVLLNLGTATYTGQAFHRCVPPMSKLCLAVQTLVQRMAQSGSLSHFEGLGGHIKQGTLNDAFLGCILCGHTRNLSGQVRVLLLFAAGYPRLDLFAMPGRNMRVPLKEVLIRFTFRCSSV